MSSKKARRRERKKQKQAERQSGRNPAWIFIGAIGLVIVALVAAALIFGGRSDDRGAPPRPGAVWSPEHGHWH